MQDPACGGVSRPNVTFLRRNGLLYRQYSDEKGQHWNKLLLLKGFRADNLAISQGNAWTYHSGITKPKQPLLQEYHLPHCFKDTEQHVRPCTTCQRILKPSKKTRATLKFVPIMLHFCRGLVFNIMEPLLKTKSGGNYIVKSLCHQQSFLRPYHSRKRN